MFLSIPSFISLCSRNVALFFIYKSCWPKLTVPCVKILQILIRVANHTFLFHFTIWKIVQLMAELTRCIAHPRDSFFCLKRCFIEPQFVHITNITFYIRDTQADNVLQSVYNFHCHVAANPVKQNTHRLVNCIHCMNIWINYRNYWLLSEFQRLMGVLDSHVLQAG